MNRELVVDLECNALAVDEVTIIWCVAVKDIETGQVCTYHDHPNVSARDGTIAEGLLILVAADALYFHNGINYDVPVIKKLHQEIDISDDKIYDTLLMSRVLMPDRDGGHSVAAWGERLGQAKVEHHEWEAFSAEMLHRCVEDANIQSQILTALKLEMLDHPWGACLLDEHKFCRILQEQQQAGWLFDTPKALKHVEDLDILKYKAGAVVLDSMPLKLVRQVAVRKLNKDGSTAARYTKLVDNPDAVYIGTAPDLLGEGLIELFNIFEQPNINSTEQIAAWLISKGCKLTEKTPSGKWRVDEGIINALEFDGKKDYQEYLKVSKVRSRLLSPNGNKGLIALARRDGRVHGGGNSAGTPTGRVTHRGIANIPGAGKFYGKEMRSCFTSEVNRKIVSVDLAGIEFRCSAHYSNDKKLIHRIQHEDVHTFNMKLLSVDTRDQAKTVCYGLMYDLQPKSLARDLGVSLAEAKRITAAYFAEYPHLKTLIDKVNKAAVRGWLRGLDGRKIWLREKYGKIASPLNSLLQCAGSILTKKATILCYEEVKADKLDAYQVLHMHDEWSYDCALSDAGDVAHIMECAIIKAGESYELRCPIVGKAKIGDNWLEVH